jgi:hypothetical protein
MLQHLPTPDRPSWWPAPKIAVLITFTPDLTTGIVTSGRRVLDYPGPGGFAVSLVMLVAVSVAAAVAASVPLTPRKAGP